LLVALSLAPGFLFAGELTGIRLSSGPIATRIVLDLDQPVSHRLLELADPNRIVIDLPHTAASASLRLPVPKGRVRSVRTGTQPDGELRIVLDLTAAADSKSFLLAPDGASGHRLVIDLSEPARTVTATRRVVEEYTGRDLVVVIDAGHGGKDSGATGVGGVREKDVTLQIAKRLASLVAEQPGLKPVMVRNDDRKVEFSDRLRIAHQAQADLFISIHADSYKDASAEGATIYALSNGRGSSETAKRLADRENAADLIGGVSISDGDDVLARVLLDLSQKYAIIKSIDVGEHIINRLGRVTTMRKTTVEQNSLIVLTSPDIPSVLVETAYLTNPREAKKLRDPAFQNVIAQQMLAGILDYFRTSAPSDSFLAHNPPPEERAPIRHVISRGETLSQIAERYRISLRELRRSNAINGDVIRIGQVLTIPTTG
jgi:N-acetylmuramoyl-L-alanine amidase